MDHSPPTLLHRSRLTNTGRLLLPLTLTRSIKMAGSKRLQNDQILTVAARLRSVIASSPLTRMIPHSIGDKAEIFGAASANGMLSERKSPKNPQTPIATRRRERNPRT
jgi:hypothetical protein